MNMSDKVIDWFRSYLTGRHQLTRVNGCDSSMREITCGVPQGSILGPLIFILYVNQLPSAVKNGQCFLYADDTAIVCSRDNITDTISDLVNDLESSMRWLKDHKLTLNLQKTKVMLFGTGRG